MFRPSRWFGWNRAGASGASGSGGGGGGGDGNGNGSGNGNESPLSRSASSQSIPHSLDHLKTLCTLMDQNKVVTEQNRTLLVETLRQIAEILIWGDQNDASVFDFFLEKNMLYFFLTIMKQKAGAFVCTQLLQTLNILFENIRNETSLYYLLSNNHVNSIIMHKFEFDDEEVMAYFISFVKTLSLKLNNHTVHFFFNEATKEFPLYTDAIKFFNHSEKMVRIAVRTLTLNVFRVREPAMLRFIRDCTAVPYFSNLAWFIGNHVMDIEHSLTSYIENRFVPNANAHSGQNLLIRVEDLVAEHLDHLHYLNDILLLNIDDLNSVLSDNLLHRLIIPLHMNSFLSVLYRNLRPTTNDTEQSRDNKTSPHVLDARHLVPDPALSPLVALFLLTQAYIIFSYGPLLNTLVNTLLRSSRIDIELNGKRCEFNPPAESLTEALDLATKIQSTTEQQQQQQNQVSSQNVSAESSSSESSPLKVPSIGGRRIEERMITATNSSNVAVNSTAQSQVQTNESVVNDDGSSHQSQTTQSSSYQPNHVTHHHHYCQAVPMETDTFPIQVITIKNWAEFPFLIAMLSCLNASVGSNVSSTSNDNLPAAEQSTSSGRTSRAREDSLTNDGTLRLGCHSPTVSRSIVELSSTDDRIILFTLSLLASILQNKALDSSFYRGLLVPPSSEASPSDSEMTNSYCSALINSLLLIMRQCCSSNSSIRIVTFELAVYLFKRIVFYYHHLELINSPCPKNLPLFLSDHQLALLEQANEEAAHLLRQLFRSTDQSVFLELFEQEAEIAAAANACDEKDQLGRMRPRRIWSHNLNLNLEQLFMDTMLMLPPEENTSTSTNNATFYLEMPKNDREKCRYAIKVFFVLRRLSFDVRGVSNATEATEEMCLPERQPDFLTMFLESNETSNTTMDQYHDLENTGELNSCTVRYFYLTNKDKDKTDSRGRKIPTKHYSAPASRADSPMVVTGRKAQRFLVMTSEHVMLIEPDVKHYGWGLIRFVSRLADMEFWSHAHTLKQECTPPIPQKSRDDNSSIYVNFRRYRMSTTVPEPSFVRPGGSIVIRFSFDDSIRCYAAKQHLTKAQSKVHDRMIHCIIGLIDLSSNVSSTHQQHQSLSRTGGAQPKVNVSNSNKTSQQEQSSSSSQVNRGRKASHSPHPHPLLSRSLAVPGGAVLSIMTTQTEPTGFNSPSTTSALARFEMLTKTKYAYPSSASSNKVKSSKGGQDSDAKRKKKGKHLKDAPDQDEDAIPLNDLSPRTVRRNTAIGAATLSELRVDLTNSLTESELRHQQHRHHSMTSSQLSESYNQAPAEGNRNSSNANNGSTTTNTNHNPTSSSSRSATTKLTETIDI